MHLDFSWLVAERERVASSSRRIEMESSGFFFLLLLKMALFSIINASIYTTIMTHYSIEYEFSVFSLLTIQFHISIICILYSCPLCVGLSIFYSILFVIPVFFSSRPPFLFCYAEYIIVYWTSRYSCHINLPRLRGTFPFFFHPLAIKMKRKKAVNKQSVGIGIELGTVIEFLYKHAVHILGSSLEKGTIG